MGRGRAESALFLHVVVFRNGWDAGRFSLELAGVAKNDFGAAAPELHLACDFDRFSLQFSNVSHILEIAGKYDYGKWTRRVVLAKIEEERTARAARDLQHLASHADVRPDLRCSFFDRNTFTGCCCGQ